MKYFRDEVLQKLIGLHTSPRFDVAMSGVSIADAAVVDLAKIVNEIGTDFKGIASVNFGQLFCAVPPIQTDNIFVEFHASSIFSTPYDKGMIGIHLAPLATTLKSFRFKNELEEIPLPFQGYDHVFCLYFYTSKNREVHTSQTGMMLGISHNGSVSLPGFFPVDGKPLSRDQYEQAAGYAALVSYVTLYCFQLVNTSHAKLVKIIPSTPGGFFYRICLPHHI